MKRPPNIPSFAAFAARLPQAAHQDGGVPARPSGEALEEAIQGSIDDLGDDLDEQLEQGARVTVAYRVARALAGAQHHVAVEEPMSVVPEAAWDAHTAAYTQGHPEGAPGWLRALSEAKVGLRPSVETTDAYSEVLWSVAVRLGIARDGTGRLGVLSLLESLEDGNVESWPTMNAMIELEDALVLHALHLATVSPTEVDKHDSETASTAKAERVLREEFGFTEPEVQGIMALTRARALEVLPSGEAGRAMTWASLEDGVRRSQQSMDLRSELSFRKLQAMVLGLTRGQGPEDQAAEFLQVIRKVSARQDAELLSAPRAVEALPPARAGRCEEVEPVVLDPAPEEDGFDADALADFDRENG